MTRALALLVLLAAPAGAETPPAAFYTGAYERIGRSAGPLPGLIDDRVVLVPEAGDGAILMTVCTASGGPGSTALRLVEDPDGDVPALITTGPGDQLWCLTHNDGGNYALLTCVTDGGARFTLWPMGRSDVTSCDMLP